MRVTGIVEASGSGGSSAVYGVGNHTSGMHTVRYDSFGNVIWNRNIASGNVQAAAGNAFGVLAGGTTSGSLAITHQGHGDGYAAKYDADGNFLYAYAFPDEDDNGASTPVEIDPQIGDQFTDYVQLYTFDADDNPIFSYELSEDVFTWGEEGFSFYASYPVDGQYAVGIIAYDFDNNFVANFEFIDYQR